ncbi:MAG: carbamoyltransferase C-terminal domain-containing protein [Chitinophagales bacterium]
MIVLGINGGFRLGYQDVSAVLVQDGTVVAAVEEERLSRIKHAPGQLPFKAINEVLRIAGLQYGDIQAVATHGATWGTEWPQRVSDYLRFNFGSCPPLHVYHHHDCHAASAYYASGLAESMVLTIDSSGDGVSLQLAIGRAGQLHIEQRIERPDSLGIFYSLVTQFCGFTRDADEYKLMGLSSYGNRQAYDFSDIITYTNGSLKLNQSYIKAIAPGAPQSTRYEQMFNAKLVDKFGAPRLPGAAITPVYRDIAASAQQHLEELLVAIVTDFHKKTGLRNLCLAGGVALNCAANQKLANLPFIDNIYIQPASSDAGVSLGAAYLATADAGINCQPMPDVYLGAEYQQQEILQLLDVQQQRYVVSTDVASQAAQLLADGGILGWFSGRAEFGPRALGSRSILACAQNQEVKQTVNRKVKFRESFRPFCPSVLEEDKARYFNGKPHLAPYMTINFNANEVAKDELPGIVHVDGTARLQTVNRHTSLMYYSLLQQVKELTGHGVLLNTSFNRSNEPMVYSPLDAVATFHSTGLDALVLGDILLLK